MKWNILYFNCRCTTCLILHSSIETCKETFSWWMQTFKKDCLSVCFYRTRLSKNGKNQWFVWDGKIHGNNKWKWRWKMYLSREEETKRNWRKFAMFRLSPNSKRCSCSLLCKGPHYLQTLWRKVDKRRKKRLSHLQRRTVFQHKCSSWKPDWDCISWMPIWMWCQDESRGY